MPQATLSMSGGSLSERCFEIAILMRELGINGDVFANKTVLDGRFENGCRALIVGSAAKSDALRVWKMAEAAHGLRCAHVEVRAHEAGCVYDVYRETACPDAPRCCE